MFAYLTLVLQTSTFLVMVFLGVPRSIISYLRLYLEKERIHVLHALGLILGTSCEIGFQLVG